MNKSLGLLLLGVSIIVLGCEKESKKLEDPNKDTYNTESVERRMNKISQAVPEVRIPSDGTEDVDVSHVQTLTQAELKPYLEGYQFKNNETRGKITTPYGDIEIMLFAASKYHRVNFVRLSKLGYFNQTVFHRVAKGFVVQGGNAENKATRLFRNKIGDFLIPNEFNPIHRHGYGTIAAAKYSEQNISKASSPFEFYIVLDKNGAHHLDNDHTVFGKVTKGMDIVEKIAEVEVDGSEWPIQNIPIKIEVYQ